jgi:hypothetical protein
MRSDDTIQSAQNVESPDRLGWTVEVVFAKGEMIRWLSPSSSRLGFTAGTVFLV